MEQYAIINILLTHIRLNLAWATPIVRSAHAFVTRMETWQFPPEIILLIAAALTCIVGLTLVWQRRAARGAYELAALLIALTIWSITYSLELTAIADDLKRFWIAVEYPLISSIPSVFLLFVLRYTGLERWRNWQLKTLLIGIPLIMVGLVWTNDAHHLIYRTEYLVTYDRYVYHTASYGVAFWFFVAFTYLCFVTASLLLIILLFRAPTLYRGQALSILIAALAPWLGNMLYIFRLSPWPYFDLTPVSFAITGGALAWGFIRYQLLDLVPAASDQLIDRMIDALIVLDTQQRIVRLNPAASQLFTYSQNAMIGKRIDLFLPRWSAIKQLPEGQNVVIGGLGFNQSWYEVRHSLLTNQQQQIEGQLVILRDITHQRQTEELLKRRLAEMMMVERVARMINSHMQLDTMIQAVVTQISSAFGYQQVSVYLLKGAVLHLQAYVGYEHVMREIRIDQAVSGRVVRTKQAAFVRDAASDPDFILIRPDTNQAIIVPLKSRDDEVLGVLLIESSGTPVLTDDDFTLLGLLADQISVAIVNAHLFSDLHYHLDFETLIMQISTRFINLQPGTLDTAIDAALAQIGAKVGVDRSYVFRFDHDFATMSNTNEWCAEGISPQKALLQQLDITAYIRQLIEAWKCNEHTYIPRVSDLPAQDRAILEQQEIQSLIMIPMLYQQQLIGFSGLDAVRSPSQWSDRTIALLRIVGEIFANAIGREAAEAKRLELARKLQEKHKMESLGVLASGIAHDFNNLLMAILGNTALARDELPRDSLAQPSLMAIESAVSRAAELTRQMMAYAGKARYAATHIAPNEYIEETVIYLRPLLPADVTVSLALDTALAPIHADSEQFRQLLINLIQNAIEAIGEQQTAGTITLHTKQCFLSHAFLAATYLAPDLPAGEYVVLTVSDTGCGIEPVNLSRIFEPFFSTKFAGRGLGLSVVFGIVRGHHGALHVQSTLGQGTTMTVCLPTVGVSDVCEGVGVSALL